MARLIRPNLGPLKWRLMRNLAEVPLNTILDFNMLEKVKNSLEASAWQNFLARLKIKKYREQKEGHAQKRRIKTRRQYLTRLAMDTIFTLRSWQKNVKREAQAIGTLAAKLADTITPMPINAEPVPSSLELIDYELTQLLDFHIAVPTECFEGITSRHAHILSQMAPKLLIIPQGRSEQSELWVKAQSVSFKFDFCTKDIDKIVNSIQKRLF